MSSPKKNRQRAYFFASIIIPSYNQAESLNKLLLELSQIVDKNWEVIVVDDGSVDQTRLIINNFQSTTLNLRYLRQEHLGPASARNLGAKKAKGEYLIFFDVDVLPHKKSLFFLKKYLIKHPEIYVVSGMWSKTQKSKSFFSQYKALRDWCFFFHESRKKGLYYFTPRVAAIKRSLFLKIGGFNTKFNKPDLESLEFSYRVEKLSPIGFFPSFLVDHPFEGISTQVSNYFKRTGFFLELLLKHRHFPKVVSTPKEAIAVMLAFLTLLFFILSIIFPPSLIFFLILLLIYIGTNFRFLKFFYQQRGVLFTIKAFFFNFFLHLVIVAGGLFFFLKQIRI